MRLKKFAVSGLFGLFDHEIPFRLNDRITIIHAPNGYGKTVVLKLISNFFGGSLAIYRQVEFEKIQFEFDDDSVITIKQRKPSPEVTESVGVPYDIAFKDSKGKNHRFDPWSESPANKSESTTNKEIARFFLSDGPRFAERYIPWLQRVTPDHFRDMRTDELVSSHEVVEKYWQFLPEGIKSRMPYPSWLRDLRQSVHCRLVETQRLMVSAKEKSSAGGREGTALIPAVKTDSAEMVALIRGTLAESATLSQSLDRTFPNRLLTESSRPLTESELRKRLASLEQRRARLTNAGLLDKSYDSALISR